MNTTTQPACPECEKLSSVANESNKIGEFLDWLNENHFTICETIETSDEWGEYVSTSFTNEQLLTKYFDIDLNKVEQERRTLLEWLRSQHGN